MLLPCDLREWVAGDDLVHFVVEAVNTVALPDPANQRGRGSEQYPPRMMLALLIYSYATGVFSSRRIERMTYQSLSVRYLCGNTHPDHDTIAHFRAGNRRCCSRVLSRC
jgi:transposase